MLQVDGIRVACVNRVCEGGVIKGSFGISSEALMNEMAGKENFAVETGGFIEELLQIHSSDR